VRHGACHHRAQCRTCGVHGCCATRCMSSQCRTQCRTCEVRGYCATRSMSSPCTVSCVWSPRMLCQTAHVITMLNVVRVESMDVVPNGACRHRAQCRVSGVHMYRASGVHKCCACKVQGCRAYNYN